MVSSAEDRLSKVRLDLGGGTEKFLLLSEKDQDLLRDHLSQPKVTFSIPRLVVGPIDEVVKEINEEISSKKQEKRPAEIRDLTRRLG